MKNPNNNDRYCLKVICYMCLISIIALSNLWAQEKDRGQEVTKLIVPVGFHNKTDKISEEQEARFWDFLMKIPANLDNKCPKDLLYLIVHFNKKIEEAGSPYRIVVESTGTPELIEEKFFKGVVKLYGNKEIGDRSINQAIVAERLHHQTGPPKCNELLSVIARNANANIILREGVIILSDYVK